MQIASHARPKCVQLQNPTPYLLVAAVDRSGWMKHAARGRPYVDENGGSYPQGGVTPHLSAPPTAHRAELGQTPLVDAFATTIRPFEQQHANENRTSSHDPTDAAGLISVAEAKLHKTQ